MRTAIISDIHGNLEALQATINDINKSNVDKIICLGDVCTLGPSPKETIQMIMGLNCPCVLGNHELALLDTSKCEEYDIAKHLKPSLDWCIRNLSSHELEFLKSFSPYLKTPIGSDRTMLAYHGSPRSSIEGITNKIEDEILKELFLENGEDLDVVVGGHIHYQLLRQFYHLKIVNSGSVGCTFEEPLTLKQPPHYIPNAEYIIIDSQKEQLSIEFKSIAYDINAFVKTVLNSSIPLKDWWKEEFIRLNLI